LRVAAAVADEDRDEAVGVDHGRVEVLDRARVLVAPDVVI
jgi:hypothetical protein